MTISYWPPARYVIRRDKISGYLLNPEHARGGPKARYFMSFGFSPTNPDELVEALAGHFTRKSAQSRRVDSPGHATRIVFEGPIRAPDGREPRVRTVYWVDEDTVAHFITAVPLTD